MLSGTTFEIPAGFNLDVVKKAAVGTLQVHQIRFHFLCLGAVLSCVIHQPAGSRDYSHVIVVLVLGEV